MFQMNQAETEEIIGAIRAHINLVRDEPAESIEDTAYYLLYIAEFAVREARVLGVSATSRRESEIPAHLPRNLEIRLKE